MGKNLLPKIVVIIVLVVLAAWTLYPPNKTLKPGIDLAGGTSLIYEIDTQELEENEKSGLAQRMITVLQRRIDPANIQNLIWRPQGNTRFEIQMPLSSAEARTKRQDYEKSLNNLLAKNISPAVIMHSVKKPAEERANDFNDFAEGDPNRLAILSELGTTYDERKNLQNKRDQLEAELQSTENTIPSAGLNLERIKENRSVWAKLEQEKLQDALKEFTNANDKIELLTGYVKTYTEWSSVLKQLTDPESGKNVQYEKAKRGLDKLNLTEDQINLILQMPLKSPKRADAIEVLKAKFPDREVEIKNIVAAFYEYRPFRGRLDDPKDLQRMLKGAGILEFRLLPTQGHPAVDAGAIASYIEALKEKGPKYASDNKFVWCEIEDIREWRAADDQRRPSIFGQFGDKYYVLASNKKEEVMQHRGGGSDWKLTKASAGREPQTGRRAIDFVLDDRGGRMFGEITGKNIGRPLCILLDGIAISAPNINSKITTRGQITGGSKGFSEDEQRDMVDKLNAGSLPARLIEQPISVKSIGPSIGADNRNKGIKAGIIGLIAVVACMLGYYLLAGSLADVALLMNVLFTLAIMAGMRATFTLPGIAGVILTIGMSVDANVLIFERIREEQAKGASLRIAIKNGYEKAFSAIFDSNLTTILTAAILYWVASEEIKGFAITLILGIASSMFTALTVTRTIFEYLLSKRIIKDHLVMLRLIRKPNINWMGYRPIFFTLSAVLTIGGVIVFFTRDDTKNNKYDIEFTGGTSVQINLKDNVQLSRGEVEDRIHGVGKRLNNPGLSTANVYSVGKSGKSYEITTTETNKIIATIAFAEAAQPPLQTVETVASAIEKAQSKFAGRLNNLVVTQDAKIGGKFIITSSQINETVVKNILTTAFPDAQISESEIDEVVNNAILSAFEDELEIQQDLEPNIVSEEKITEELIASYPELAEFTGGIKITCKIERTTTTEDINARFAALRFKPDMQELNWYSYRILDSNLNPMKQTNQPVETFVYLSAEPEAGLRELSDDEWQRFVENEKTKVLAAAKLETSLPRVTQIDPSIGGEQKTRAIIAIVLSLLAMLIYIWIRFGDFRFGFGAVITLFHDTCVTVGTVTACTYIAKTTIGQNLLIGDFKIDLAMIAAFLTLLGYSINDTIVVYDRIRENRRKGAVLTPQIINNSINETLSRTLLTGVTTLLVVAIMYIFGGKGMRGFNFAILFGIIEGTYSSIAISAPILLLRIKTKEKKTNRKSTTN